MQLFRRFFRFYNEINVYGTTSGRSNDDYKCFIDYYKAIAFAAFSRLQKKYQPKTAHNAFFLILYGTGMGDKDMYRLFGEGKRGETAMVSPLLIIDRIGDCPKLFVGI